MPVIQRKHHPAKAPRRRRRRHQVEPDGTLHIRDRQGLHEQAMAARIRPIERTMRLVGRAHTVLTADVYQRAANP